MSGLFAIVAAFLALAVPLAIPLFIQRWRSLLLTLAAAAAFFTWLTLDLQRPESQNWVGPFLGGLMLVGFAAGTVAKFVMLIGRPKTSETDSSSS